jgi:hypothetical protein
MLLKVRSRCEKDPSIRRGRQARLFFTLKSPEYIISRRSVNRPEVTFQLVDSNESLWGTLEFTRSANESEHIVRMGFVFVLVSLKFPSEDGIFTIRVCTLVCSFKCLFTSGNRFSLAPQPSCGHSRPPVPPVSGST